MHFASLVALTAVKIKVEVFRVVTSCNVVAGYQRFGTRCCFYLQGHNPGDLNVDYTFCVTSL
jgi:hypothetical protein